MSRGVRWYLLGSTLMLTLAGCGRGAMQYSGEREPWRREAEIACLNSGTVKEGPGIVKITPVDGPGMCGVDYPLKVSALGESSPLGYMDEAIRPPGAVPNGSAPVAQPRWPITQQPVASQPLPPTQSQYGQPQYASPGGPMSIEAPGASYNSPQQAMGAPPQNLQAPSNWQRSSGAPSYQQPQPAYQRPQPAYQQQQYSAPPAAAVAPPSRRAAVPPPDDEDELPSYARPGAPPSTMPAQRERPLPPLGPERNPQVIAASTPIEIRPAATLACPIVSALDRWFANAVQPAAKKWFNQAVVEVKQISAYSCRGMNGQPGAHISEHAFGNALDIAAFVLADGHRITVEQGWKGSPEEQGFLRDVQGSACDQFTTVLAPGSNQYHYNHIHVDLMRRSSGRRICQPGAIDGEVVASRARMNPKYASAHPVEPPPTRRYDPPLPPGDDPFAWRGDARRGEPATTGSIASRRPSAKSPAADDNDWVEEPGPRPAIDWSTDRTKVF